jgi:acetate kinase
MAVTLIVNPGSSSKKYALYDGERLLLSAHIEHDEEGVTLCTSVNGTADRCEPISESSYHTSLLDFVERALAEKVIPSATLIDVVGIRVVAPGTYFTRHRLVDDAYMRELKAAATRAPLHVPHTEKELTVLRQALPHAHIIGVSDSAFHTTMPAHVREYSIPGRDAAAFDIHRFGYHGLSVASVMRRLPSLGASAEGRVIVCHLGSGVSVTALTAGKSVDTTMGYAPGSGLIMGSRAGDLDTGALLALMQTRSLKPVDAEMYLQTHGGLRGLADESDLRVILNRRASGDESSHRALDSFVYGLKKAIGGYVAVLGGLDTIVFTATAGERSPVLRALITETLGGIGVVLDAERNESCISKEGVISPAKARVSVIVVKTQEAHEIKRITETFVQ